ncbi:MAG: hypothetical protein COA82_04010 [Alkaliphilus sp.]|nr:AAA family ATPase [bacterium AH-315-E09]PHS35607.1 MAG: hypothetical protein COA82_04010 [Alkaliphilus sp.]
MRILIVGIACVGKSTVGKLLAERLGYKFFDYDLEIENYFGQPISFIQKDSWLGDSYRKKVRVVLEKILRDNHDNFVVAMTPSSLMREHFSIIKKHEGIITIALKDKSKYIFERLRFYDEYSKPIDIEINERQKKLYLKEISEDNEYFSRTYKKATMQYHINGKDALLVTNDLEKLLFEEDS